MFCKHWCQQNWLPFFTSAIILLTIFYAEASMSNWTLFWLSKKQDWVVVFIKFPSWGWNNLSRLFWTVLFRWWILKALFYIQFVVLFVYMYKLIEYIIYMLCMHLCMQRFYVNWLLMVSCLFLIHFSKMKLISVRFVFHNFKFSVIVCKGTAETSIHFSQSWRVTREFLRGERWPGSSWGVTRYWMATPELFKIFSFIFCVFVY